MSLVGVVIVKFLHAIARIVKGIEIGLGRGVAFGTGIAVPFAASLLASGSRAPISLSRGGCDRRVVAALSVPQDFRSLHHGRGCLVWSPALTASLMDGGRRMRKIAKKMSGSEEEKLLEGDVV